MAANEVAIQLQRRYAIQEKTALDLIDLVYGCYTGCVLVFIACKFAFFAQAPTAMLDARCRRLELLVRAHHVQRGCALKRFGAAMTDFQHDF